MESPLPLDQSGYKPWSETACSPWLSPSAKSLLGLHLVGAAFGYNCLDTVSPSWCGHYFSARPMGLQIMEIWNHSHTAVSCKMHSPVSMQRIKHCIHPQWESVCVIVIRVKNTGVFQFTHVAISASEINLWFIWDLKNVNPEQIIIIKQSDNSSVVTVTKCQCLWMDITPWKAAERGVCYCPVSHPESTDPLGYWSTVSGLPAISEDHISVWLRISPCTIRISACLSSPFCSIQHLAGTHWGWTVPLIPIRHFLGSNLSPDWPTSGSASSPLLSGGRLSADNGLYAAQLAVLTVASSPPARESPIQP